MMSSAAVPLENIPGIVKAIPGSGEKPFAFPPESLFAFSPESRSPSARNRFHVHPGILFAFARNPHQQSTPGKMTFGVLQPKPSGGFSIFNLNWTGQTPLWAGESPQFVGLDQINVNFPTCTGAAATAEQRYDLVMSFQSPAADPNLGIGFAELYMPLIISPGEPGYSGPRISDQAIS